jgi:hypothetical protein
MSNVTYVDWRGNAGMRMNSPFGIARSNATEFDRVNLCRL